MRHAALIVGLLLSLSTGLARASDAHSDTRRSHGPSRHRTASPSHHRSAPVYRDHDGASAHDTGHHSAAPLATPHHEEAARHRSRGHGGQRHDGGHGSTHYDC